MAEKSPKKGGGNSKNGGKVSSDFGIGVDCVDHVGWMVGYLRHWESNSHERSDGNDSSKNCPLKTGGIESLPHDMILFLPDFSSTPQKKWILVDILALIFLASSITGERDKTTRQLCQCSQRIPKLTG